MVSESPNANGSDPDITYLYDENGSVRYRIYGDLPSDPENITDPHDEYRYNLSNRLIAYTPESGSAVNFVYDPDGIRVGKIVDPGGANEEVIEYLNDPYNHTGYAQVLKESSTEWGDYAFIIGSDVIAGVRGQSPSQARNYLLSDGHGSVRQISNNTGGILYDYSYDAYGNIAEQTASFVKLLYTGEAWDEDLGMYYLRARWYDPATGRFNRLDPYAGNIQGPQSLHKYLYCHGNPINGTDPSGEFSISETITVVAIIGTVGFLVEGPLEVAMYQAREKTLAAYDADAISYLGAGLQEQMNRDMLEIEDPDLRGMTLSFWHELGDRNRIVTYQTRKAEETVLRGIDTTFDAAELAGIGLGITGGVMRGGAGVTAKIVWCKPHGGQQHWNAMSKFASDRFLTGEAKEIYTNRALSTITGGRVKSRLMPDVTEVMPSGKLKITQFLFSESRRGGMQKEKEFRRILEPLGLLESYKKVRIPN